LKTEGCKTRGARELHSPCSVSGLVLRPLRLEKGYVGCKFQLGGIQSLSEMLIIFMAAKPVFYGVDRKNEFES